MSTRLTLNSRLPRPRVPTTSHAGSLSALTMPPATLPTVTSMQWEVRTLRARRGGQTDEATLDLGALSHPWLMKEMMNSG